MPALTILIADDHPLFRGALRQAVGGIDPGPVIIEAGDFDAARAAAGLHADADLLLLDLAMPGVSGFSGLMSLRAEFPGLPIVVVSATDDATTIRRALELGASGFISKSAGIEAIRACIQSVLEGDICAPKTYLGDAEPDADVADLLARLRTLTPQQSRVLGMLAEGLLNKQIADRLDVQERTVKAHLTAIFERLGVRNRTQAGVVLRELELSDPARQLEG